MVSDIYWLLALSIYLYLWRRYNVLAVHRLAIIVFGFNIMFSGLCTMAHAQDNPAPMGSDMVCHEAMQRPSASGCNEAGEQFAYHLEGECAGGSCFVGNTAGERVTSSSDHTLINVSSLPPQLGQPMLLADEFQVSGQAEFGRAPPGQLKDVILRL